MKAVDEINKRVEERGRYIKATNMLSNAKEDEAERIIMKNLKEMVKFRLQEPGNKMTFKYVTPKMLEEVIGRFTKCTEPTGVDARYWAETDKYKIFGSMYDATATITVK